MITAISPYLRFLCQEGLGETVRRIGSSIAGALYQNRTMIFYERGFTESAAREKTYNGETLIREIFSDSVQYIAEYMYMDTGELAERFKRGMRCFIAEHKGHFAGYLWVTSKDEHVPEINDWFRVPERSVYIFNVRVTRKFRGNGIFTSLLEHVCDEMHGTDCVSGYAAVLWTNIASAKVFEKCGFKQLKRVHFVKVLGSRKYRETTY